MLASQGLDLFAQVGDIEFAQAAFAQQRRPLLQPQAQVAVRSQDGQVSCPLYPLAPSFTRASVGQVLGIEDLLQAEGRLGGEDIRGQTALRSSLLAAVRVTLGKHHTCGGKQAGALSD